ncbi:hypothetical protein Tco_0797620 [Tanacetum coccineum]
MMIRSLAIHHLELFSNEFNRLSGMDDVLFTYEVEIPGLSSIPCDKKEGDDSDDGDLDVYEPQVCYDKNDGIYAKALIFVNKRLVRLMDITVEQWLDLIYGDHMKVDVKAFNKSNYLLKIDTDLLTSDILGFKTYGEFKNELMDEWNKGIPWVPEKPWSKDGIPTDDIHHIVSLSVSKMEKLNGPLLIQMMKDSIIEENYRGWFEFVT